MQALGYVRVSTEGQAVDGVSLEAQQSRIRAWSEANGYRLLGLHVDAGLSGCRADNRPALQAAITEACKQKAALIVYSLSRLARSTKDAILISERLARSGADLVSLSERIDTTSAAGKLFFRLMISLSEFERDLVAERTKGALSHMRQQGKRIGKIPYGYDLAKDGTSLIPNAAEQDGLRLIERLRTNGFGRRLIAAELTAQGVATKTGASWSPQAVGRILHRAPHLQPLAEHVVA